MAAEGRLACSTRSSLFHQSIQPQRVPSTLIPTALALPLQPAQLALRQAAPDALFLYGTFDRPMRWMGIP